MGLQIKTPQTLGVLLTLAYGFLVYYWLFYFQGGPTGVIVAVCLFPVLLGGATQLLWDPIRLRTALKVWGTSLLIVLAISIVLFVIEQETLICIAMAVPLILPLQFAGVYLARLAIGYFESDENEPPSTKLRAVLALPLIIPLMPGLDVFPEKHVTVTTEIVIAAPVQTVWDHTVEIRQIEQHERIWTISHNILGSPRPVDASVSGDIRYLTWTKGVTFQEHITATNGKDLLKWRFVFPDKAALRAIDPHVYPDSEILHLESGSYELIELEGGKTQLTLNTNYTLKTPMNGYLALWGELFLNDFHSSVLSVIKSRSEKGETDLTNGSSA